MPFMPLLLAELPVNQVTEVIPYTRTVDIKSPGTGGVDAHSGSAYSPNTQKFIALYGSDSHNAAKADNGYFAIDFNQSLASLAAQDVSAWSPRPSQTWGDNSDYPVAGFEAGTNAFRSYTDAGNDNPIDAFIGPYNPPSHSYHLDEQVIQNNVGQDILISTYKTTAHMFLPKNNNYAPQPSSRFDPANLGYRILIENGAANRSQIPVINLHDYSESSAIDGAPGMHVNAKNYFGSRSWAWINGREFFAVEANNGMVYKLTSTLVGNDFTITDKSTNLTIFSKWPYHVHQKLILVGEYLTAFYETEFQLHIAHTADMKEEARNLTISREALNANAPLLSKDGVTSLWDIAPKANFPVTKLSDSVIGMIIHDKNAPAGEQGRLILWRVPNFDGATWDGIGDLVDTGLTFDSRGKGYNFNVAAIREYADEGSVFLNYVNLHSNSWNLQVAKLNSNLDSYFLPADTLVPVIAPKGAIR
jgi:hypothetical protein